MRDFLSLFFDVAEQFCSAGFFFFYRYIYIYLDSSVTNQVGEESFLMISGW